MAGDTPLLLAILYGYDDVKYSIIEIYFSEKSWNVWEILILIYRICEKSDKILEVFKWLK